MNEPVFVACDMGTTLIKAGVIDLHGKILASSAVPSRLETPRPGVVEQDLLEIEGSAHEAIRKAVAESGRASDIAGVSFSSQMAGIGTVDKNFTPAAPFDSWLDSRCGQDIVEMQEFGERITELSGGPATYSHGPKERWLKRTQPAVYRETVAFQVPGPFVAARMAGLSAADAYIDTANLCFSNLSDTDNETWSSELIEMFGLDHEKLPRIVNSLDQIGEVTVAASASTGIPAGTPIAAGGGDQIVACLGTGINTPGQASDSAGTASLFTMYLNKWAPDVQKQAMITSKAIVPGDYLSFSYINGGGLGVDWFSREILPTSGDPSKDRDLLQAQASKIAPGSGGLLWLPNFQGGVTPPKPYLRSGWVGLTASHTSAHLYRAILEGIALEYATWAARAPEILGHDLFEVRAMGGGSKSDLWLSIKADVLGVPFVKMSHSESALLGNALIAAYATGHITDLKEASKGWHELSEPVVPSTQNHQKYQQLLAIYTELNDRVDPVFQELSNFSQ